MRNIWEIFKRDALRIRTNVIAIIAIVGITVVPCLYAWFNIAASWDPYKNTGNLKAVSYTHLDVYKRQHYYEINSALQNPFWISSTKVKNRCHPTLRSWTTPWHTTSTRFWKPFRTTTSGTCIFPGTQATATMIRDVTR